MEYNKYTFENGLRLVTVPMPSVESVTVLILVGVGSRYEEKDINGISHFLEHMAFKGTEKRPTALSIATTIDGIGGEFNAFTSKDHTGFYIKAAKKHLPLLVDVLSDMLLHSKFDAQEIEKEKGVIIEEINMYEDTPMRKIGDLYENLLYGDTKLGRDISGRKEVIKSVKRQDFINYLDRFYSPLNTVVVVAGGIDVNSKVKSQKSTHSINSGLDIRLSSAEVMLSQVEASKPQLKTQNLIENYLGGWKEKKVERAEEFKDQQKEPAVLVKFKDTQQAHLCLGVRSYRLTHRNRYKLGVLTNILGGGMSSRLFIEVRERRGLAYYIRSGNEMYFDVGNFVTQAGVDVERIDDAIKVMLEQLFKIRKEEVGEEELNKAKENLKGKMILDLEDSRNVAGLYGIAEVLEGKIKTPVEILKRIDEVTVMDVKSIACDIFKREWLNLAVIGPYRDQDRFRKLLKLT